MGRIIKTFIFLGLSFGLFSLGFCVDTTATGTVTAKYENQLRNSVEFIVELREDNGYIEKIDFRTQTAYNSYEMGKRYTFEVERYKENAGGCFFFGIIAIFFSLVYTHGTIHRLYGRYIAKKHNIKWCEPDDVDGTTIHINDTHISIEKTTTVTRF